MHLLQQLCQFLYLYHSYKFSKNYETLYPESSPKMPGGRTISTTPPILKKIEIISGQPILCKSIEEHKYLHFSRSRANAHIAVNAVEVRLSMVASASGSRIIEKKVPDNDTNPKKPRKVRSSLFESLLDIHVNVPKVFGSNGTNPQARNPNDGKKSLYNATRKYRYTSRNTSISFTTTFKKKLTLKQYPKFSRTSQQQITKKRRQC